jgi:hypothetical protein
MDFGNEYFSRLYLTCLAGRSVQTVVVGEALFEHQGDTLTHHPYSIDRIDQYFGVCLQ